MGPPRLAVPEQDDVRVAQAIARLAREGRAAIAETSAAARAEMAGELATLRSLDPPVAERLLHRPEYLGLMMLRRGEADALVVGATRHTADVLIAARTVLDVPPEVLVSGAFVMSSSRWRPSRLLFADCAVNPSPDADQLAGIAMASAASAVSLLGVEPRVALLSFSTHGSAVHPDVEKVARATEIARRLRPELAIDGELQADAALDREIAGRKLAEGSRVAGEANVLVFPDLDAANIAYKLVRSLAGAAALGTFLQGLPRPVVKLSRGATVDEIADTAAILVGRN
jgi:phosphate acetyltransferase